MESHDTRKVLESPSRAKTSISPESLSADMPNEPRREGELPGGDIANDQRSAEPTGEHGRATDRNPTHHTISEPTNPPLVPNFENQSAGQTQEQKPEKMSPADRAAGFFLHRIILDICDHDAVEVPRSGPSLMAKFKLDWARHPIFEDGKKARQQKGFKHPPVPKHVFDRNRRLGSYLPYHPDQSYLPSELQDLLLSGLRRMLEEAYYHFTRTWFRVVFDNMRWKHPKKVELQKWQNLIEYHDVPQMAIDAGPPFWHLLERVAPIRLLEAKRLDQMPVTSINLMLGDIIGITRGLRDEERTAELLKWQAFLSQVLPAAGQLPDIQKAGIELLRAIKSDNVGQQSVTEKANEKALAYAIIAINPISNQIESEQFNDFKLTLKNYLDTSNAVPPADLPPRNTSVVPRRTTSAVPRPRSTSANVVPPAGLAPRTTSAVSPCHGPSHAPPPMPVPASAPPVSRERFQVPPQPKPQVPQVAAARQQVTVRKSSNIMSLLNDDVPSKEAASGRLPWILSSVSPGPKLLPSTAVYSLTSSNALTIELPTLDYTVPTLSVKPPTPVYTAPNLPVRPPTPEYTVPTSFVRLPTPEYTVPTWTAINHTPGYRTLAMQKNTGASSSTNAHRAFGSNVRNPAAYLTTVDDSVFRNTTGNKRRGNGLNSPASQRKRYESNNREYETYEEEAGFDDGEVALDKPSSAPKRKSGWSMNDLFS